MKSKILLLEDDDTLQAIIAEYLRDMGYFVSTCDNVKDALDLAYEKNFDLWLFDVKVPGEEDIKDGFELLKTLRDVSKDTPSIFITSLCSIQDIQTAYGVGCDDYLKKPFELTELNLRITALLKRNFKHLSSDFIEFDNDTKYDILNKILYHKDKIVPLTNKETVLLSLLLSNPGKLLDKDKIFDSIWEYEETPSELSLRAYIKNLRKFIGKDKIISKRNIGYGYVSQH